MSQESPPVQPSEQESPSGAAAPYPGSGEVRTGFLPPAPGPEPDPHSAVSLRGLTKVFGIGTAQSKIAVNRLSLDVPHGAFYGLVGRNGAGKTTALSMLTGLLRPTEGRATVSGIDVWGDPRAAKMAMGVLPDGMNLFERLSGRQLVTYAGLLRGMDRDTVRERTEDLLRAMDLTDDGGTAVQDYSAGMRKKIMLAAAMVHAPGLLVLDEPFEAVDPVSATNIRELLQDYAASGGTVIVSSHVMDLVQRMCDHVAVVDNGRLLAAGTVEQVRGDSSLEETFVDLVGGRTHVGEGLTWLRPR
ncbi:ABC transporter ATP-binding protein [Kocuria sp. JC486]|uniref:ABC transporter ATP-binding protein n=1 Tax=Kocuria sp. JC486 TaxID=1970736 RepID=UPI0014210784|nr:ABC transporter ATP-binding protein [Kocuria sp. JC486]NHU84565.1 ABC transporter ATP-binding protein [Kocuria sp. JC486]